MKASRKHGIPDRDIRHFIYTTFAGTCRPPTTSETAGHFGVSIAAVENAYERLAAAHHIALHRDLMRYGWRTLFQVFRPTMLPKWNIKNIGATEYGTSSASPPYSVKMPWDTPRAGVGNATNNWTSRSAGTCR